jgi:hypothetical protein
MFVWSIYSLFVLNTGLKRDSPQIMIFVFVSWTWSIFELKTRFETWITRNGVNGVSLFNLSYLITLKASLCSKQTPSVPIKYFMFDSSIYILVVLNSACKRYSLQMMIFVYVSWTWSTVELNTSFETWITRNDVNGVNFFHLSYLVTLMAYLCSQRTPKVQVKYFKFDWSIYSLFVLNSGWKRDSLQIMIFEYLCSTWSIF